MRKAWEALIRLLLPVGLGMGIAWAAQPESPPPPKPLPPLPTLSSDSLRDQAIRLLYEDPRVLTLHDLRFLPALIDLLDSTYGRRIGETLQKIFRNRDILGQDGGEPIRLEWLESLGRRRALRKTLAEWYRENEAILRTSWGPRSPS